MSYIQLPINEPHIGFYANGTRFDGIVERDAAPVVVVGVEREREDVAGEVGRVGGEAVAWVVGLAPVGEDLVEGGGEDGVEEGGQEGDGLDEATFLRGMGVNEVFLKGRGVEDGREMWKGKGKGKTYSITRRASPKTKHPLRRCERLFGYSSIRNLLLSVSPPNRIDSPTSAPPLPTCTIDLSPSPIFHPSNLPHKLGLCHIPLVSCLRLRFPFGEE